MSDRITPKQIAFAKAFGNLCTEHGIVAGTCTVEIKTDPQATPPSDWFNVQLETSPGFPPKIMICHRAYMEIQDSGADPKGPVLMIVKDHKK